MSRRKGPDVKRGQTEMWGRLVMTTAERVGAEPGSTLTKRTTKDGERSNWSKVIAPAGFHASTASRVLPTGTKQRVAITQRRARNAHRVGRQEGKAANRVAYRRRRAARRGVRPRTRWALLLLGRNRSLMTR